MEHLACAPPWLHAVRAICGDRILAGNVSSPVKGTPGRSASATRSRRLSVRWRPGLALARIAAALQRQAGSTDIDRVLEALRDEWQECFYVAVVAEEAVVCVHCVATSDVNRVSVSVPLGKAVSTPCVRLCQGHFGGTPGTDQAEQAGRCPAVAVHRSDAHAPCRHREGSCAYSRTEICGCDQEIETGVVAYAVPFLGPDTDHRSLGVIGPRNG